MKAHQRYLKNLNQLISKLSAEDESIEKAAIAMANALEKDGLIHVLVRATHIC